MRVVETYERVTWQARKSVPCPECGKKIRRQRTFGQTLNPFNRDRDGFLKTRQQIRRELYAEAAVWQERPEMCGDCFEAAAP